MSIIGVKILKHHISPNRQGFGVDPFGYGALAWHKWGIVQTLAGFPVDITKPAKNEDLKSPILWLAQAHALSEAAIAVIQKEPDFESMPVNMRGICDCQYMATALMLVGYSLEVCLKAMTLIECGIEEYCSREKKLKHHRLDELAGFIPDLTKKERVILKLLTHFVYWAGRYPDPGSGREDDPESIFLLSEKHRISAKDLFALSTKVMRYSEVVVDKK